MLLIDLKFLLCCNHVHTCDRGAKFTLAPNKTHNGVLKMLHLGSKCQVSQSKYTLCFALLTSAFGSKNIHILLFFVSHCFVPGLLKARCQV